MFFGLEIRYRVFSAKTGGKPLLLKDTHCALKALYEQSDLMGR